MRCMTPLESPFLTAEEVAALIRQHPQTVRGWARDRRIPAVSLPGGQWRFHRDVIDAIMRGELKPDQSPVATTPKEQQ